MKRKLNQSLKSWKVSPSRQPLLLRGARQCGKTYLVNEFGHSDFTAMVSINFEKEKKYKACFKTLDAKQIVQQLELHTGQSIVPGETLLFLDEIQDCPEAIESLRYFYEEMPALHVIGAGSLLEFALSQETFSMPVGRVQFLYLYPVTFMEMLTALGHEKLVAFLEKISVDDKIPESVHQQLLTYVHLYFVTGGMPRVVDLYVTHESLLMCREAQSALLNTYRSDFSKYATQIQRQYCERVFDQSFDLIAKHVKYSDIDPDMDYRGLKHAMKLLVQANVLTPVYYTSATGFPLSATRVEKKYKLLFLDLGLVQAAGRVSPELLLSRDIMQINKGALTEQFVGQHLLTVQPAYEQIDLYYWKRDSKNSQAEIDYVIAVDDKIVPIEVKSGSRGRLRSLHQFMDTHNANLGIKVSIDAFDTGDAIWSIPLYMIEQLPRLVREHNMR